MTPFQKDLERLINRYCMENESNTPDFILAQYLLNCLASFDMAVRDREVWYGRNPDAGPGAQTLEATVTHDASR